MTEIREFTPETLDEAAALLLASDSAVRPSPEGTTLVGQARDDDRTYTIVLHLERLSELNRMEYDERSGLRIGAAVPYATLLEFPPVRRLYPILADGCAAILRGKRPDHATPGGSLSAQPLSLDLGLPLSCLRATTAILGPHGWSEMAVEALVAASGKPSIQPGEFTVDVRLPAPVPRSSGAYLRSTCEGDGLPGGAAVGTFLIMEEDLTTCCGLRLFLSFPPEAPRRVPEVERFLGGRRLDEAVLEEAGLSAARSAMRHGAGSGEALCQRAARLIRHTILEALTRIRAADLL
jgi:carbon-monoxide dehydrogenase medium subunit